MGLFKQLIYLGMLCAFSAQADLLPHSRPWILVETQLDRLTVRRADRILEVFSPIAVGSSGVGIKTRRGDNKTPLGTFRVGWINPYSRFNLFIGLDYPNLQYAERAYHKQMIDQATLQRIRFALRTGVTPPQNTILGGFIGIHGIGAGDPQVHAVGIDWTSGCIALTNQQIARLGQWIEVGTMVEIR